MWPWERYRERIDALDARVRDLEKAEFELEELRRTATNALRSLRRAAANAQEPVRGPNDHPPLTAPLTLSEARARVARGTR